VNQECADEALNEKEQKEKDRSIVRKKRFNTRLSLLDCVSPYGLETHFLALLNFSMLRATKQTNKQT
jgi:hypothetical protein